jgi:hypothetical protein
MGSRIPPGQPATAVRSSFASLPPFQLLASIPSRVIHTRRVLSLNVGWEQVIVDVSYLCTQRRMSV